MYIGIIGHSGEDKMNIAHLYGNTLSWILEHPGHETPTLEFIKDYYSWCESLSDDSNWKTRYILCLICSSTQGYCEHDYRYTF